MTCISQLGALSRSARGLFVFRRFSNGSSASSNSGSRREIPGNNERSGPKHPKHLKGREIGLWYAQRNKNADGGRQANDEPRPELMSSVSLDSDVARQLDHCVARLEKEMRLPKAGKPEPINRSKASGPPLNAPRKPANPSASVHECRTRLPVYRARAEVLRTINNSQVTVISGETGSGKTTQVPQFLLDQFLEDEGGESCFIICTQPRRISAITVAERVAYERGENVGQSSVGYKIRLESKEPQRTSGKILYCTTGIVLQFLQSDPLLKEVTHLIVDEVHERSIHSDLLLGVLRERILPRRPTLKVVCMSATLDSDSFASYFGENCGRVSVEGQLFPVKDYYLEDFFPKIAYNPKQTYQNEKVLREVGRRASLLEQYGYSAAQVRALSRVVMDKVDTDLVVACVEHICATTTEGAILVFMPGWDGISDVCKKLNDFKGPSITRRNSLILPLHSMLPTSDQKRVFDKPPPGVRKIIVSTTIAETSVTIEDVVYVVDSGKTKLTTIDVARNNLSCLGEQWVSKANSRQRLGRAGRVQPGECYKLFTKMDFDSMEDYQQPEMARSSLESLILYVKELQLGEPETFLPQCMTPPSSDAVRNSIRFLIQLGALDKHAEVTGLGKYLSSFSTDPRLGKMLILGTMFGCLEPTLSICATLDFKDSYVQPMGKLREVDAVRARFANGVDSDHVMIANTIGTALEYGDKFCRENFLSPQTIKMLKNLREQYRSQLKEQGLSETSSIAGLETLRAVICGGLYPGVAMGKFKEPRYNDDLPRGFSSLQKLFTDSEHRLCFHPKSVLANQRRFNTQFFAYFLKQRTDSGVMLFDATAVHPLALLLFAADCSYNFDEEVFILNGWMKIRCARSNADLIKRLQITFQYSLDEFLGRRHNELHREFLTLLSQAFEQEFCQIVPVQLDR